MFFRSLLVYFIPVIFLISILGGIESCPAPSDIEPCQCVSWEYLYLFFGTGITCANIFNSDKVAEVFRNLRALNINRFELSNSSLQFIPNGVFDYIYIQVLDFRNVTFIQLFDNVPKNPGTNWFTMKQCRVTSGLDWAPFAAFSQLYDLELVDVPLNGLSDFRQYISKDIQIINFSGCNLRKLRKDEFQELTKLKRIEVTRDKIRILKRSMFPKPSHIYHLSFDHNQISSIPEDLFSAMELQFISFENNHLTVLPENTFKPAANGIMHLEGNLLVCECGMEWLLKLKEKKFYGRCDVPKIVEGKSLLELSPYDFIIC